MERATDFVHQLDARQRAMLKAMGITVWAPTLEKASSTTVAESPSPVASAPAVSPPRVAAVVPPAPAPAAAALVLQRPAIDAVALAGLDAEARPWNAPPTL